MLIFKWSIYYYLPMIVLARWLWWSNLWQIRERRKISQSNITLFKSYLKVKPSVYNKLIYSCMQRTEIFNFPLYSYICSLKSRMRYCLNENANIFVFHDSTKNTTCIVRNLWDQKKKNYCSVMISKVILHPLWLSHIKS